MRQASLLSPLHVPFTCLLSPLHVLFTCHCDLKLARLLFLTGAALSLQGKLQKVHLWKTNKTKFTILDNMSGILHPGRFTLLLGPPGAGKSTLLNALAGRLQKHPTCRVRAGLLK